MKILRFILGKQEKLAIGVLFKKDSLKMVSYKKKK
jgi:hypothetical protein